MQTAIAYFFFVLLCFGASSSLEYGDTTQTYHYLNGSLTARQVDQLRNTNSGTWFTQCPNINDAAMIWTTVVPTTSTNDCGVIISHFADNATLDFAIACVADPNFADSFGVELLAQVQVWIPGVFVWGPLVQHL